LLLAHPGTPDQWNVSREHRAMFEKWRGKVARAFDERQANTGTVESETEELQDHKRMAEENVEIDLTVTEQMEGDGEAQPQKE
jgi:hypothetical protein